MMAQQAHVRRRCHRIAPSTDGPHVSPARQLSSPRMDGPREAMMDSALSHQPPEHTGRPRPVREGTPVGFECQKPAY